MDPDAFPDYPLDELLANLEKRKGFVDGVVVSGGEPTIDPGLPAFLSQLKALQLDVKLDTNGLAPQVVERLLEAGLVDYFAVDIKTAPSRYHELHQRPFAVNGLRETVKLLKQAAIEVEFRTTCIPALIGFAEIDEMADLLDGVPLWVLQQFVPGHAMDPLWQEMAPYQPDILHGFAEQMRTAAKDVYIRGL